MNFPATLSSVFNFGKHEGKTIEDVIDIDPAYITWCLDEVEDFKLDAGAARYYRENQCNYLPNTHFNRFA